MAAYRCKGGAAVSEDCVAGLKAPSKLPREEFYHEAEVFRRCNFEFPGQVHRQVSRSHAMPRPWQSQRQHRGEACLVACAHIFLSRGVFASARR